MRAKYSYETIQALKNSISELLPPINYLFSDVYDEPTSNLKEQRENLIAHLKKYEDYYKIRKFKP